MTDDELIASGIYQEVDGFYYYDPPKGGGVYAAHTLREIADKLDALNRELAEKIVLELRPPIPQA